MLHLKEALAQRENNVIDMIADSIETIADSDLFSCTSDGVSVSKDKRLLSCNISTS